MTKPSAPQGKKADFKMTLALAGAVVAAVALAVITSRTSHGASLRAEQPALAAAAAAEVDSPPAADGPALSGEVLETLPVSKYTYLRLRTSDGEVWAAVPSASVAVGRRVAIADATRMVDFQSSTLKRTFKVIYFGNLAAPAGAELAPKFSAADVPPLDDDSTLPPGHPELGASAALGPVADSDPLPPGHPEIGNPAPHAGLADSANEPTMPARQIAPAQGGNAHVISELTAQRQTLAGQRVRVRGEVVKVTPDVNGRAFFHLRDSSGRSPSGGEQATDLVATALVAPKRGAIAVFEGTLRSDVDVGIGYKYPALLEDATIVGE